MSVGARNRLNAATSRPLRASRKRTRSALPDVVALTMLTYVLRTPVVVSFTE